MLFIASCFRAPSGHTFGDYPQSIEQEVGGTRQRIVCSAFGYDPQVGL